MTETEGFPKIEVTPKTGDESLHHTGHVTTKKLIDFWRWSASDLLSNAKRGILAEYIVACALGLDKGVRAEWDAYDLVTPAGIKIEVKSAAYLQSWYHVKLSNITFSIRPTCSWNAETNCWEKDSKRQSDVYVFCILHHINKATVDPLDLDQWIFYILPTAILNEQCVSKSQISLSSLLKLNPCKVKFDEMATCLQKLHRRNDLLQNQNLLLNPEHEL